ncbi:MAG TPA: hypothetical protein VHC49_12835 [Mycobacteriales bacterium]|nr:hypothetical protein [Mycobacteriales bacterium]
MRTALAATVHDPYNHLLDWLRRAGPALRETFSGFGILATEPTSNEVVGFLEDLGATVHREPPDGNVGRHRRQAVSLAGNESVLYSDLDNLLRWIDADRPELERLLSTPDADLIVIGRSAPAMAACPRRLRDTEAIVNHIYALETGRIWDLMFAVRLLSPFAAKIVADQGRENTLASDVEWPLLVERAGLSVGYREAGGLSYRTRQDFDAAHDRNDGSPRHWIQRVEIAADHCRVLKQFLAAP